MLSYNLLPPYHRGSDQRSRLMETGNAEPLGREYLWFFCVTPFPHLTPPHLPFPGAQQQIFDFFLGGRRGVVIEQPSQCCHKHPVISLPRHTVRSVKSALWFSLYTWRLSTEAQRGQNTWPRNRHVFHLSVASTKVYFSFPPESDGQYLFSTKS